MAAKPAVPTVDVYCAGVDIVFPCEVERDRCEANHFQVGAALGAAQLVTPIDIELVDIEFHVALGAGRHSQIKCDEL